MMFYTRVESRFDDILVRYVDNKGNKGLKKVKYKPHIYMIDRAGKSDVVDCVNKQPLSKKEFDSITSFKEFLKKASNTSGLSIYGNKNPCTQFVAQYFNTHSDYDISKINGAIIDIEYFPAVKDADGNYVLDDNGDMVMGKVPDDVTVTTEFPINAITLYDWNNKVFYVFGLEELDGIKVGTYKHNKNHKEIGSCNVEYKGYTSESLMLMEFSNLLARKAYDFYSGWNFKFFDLPYLINRTIKVCGEAYAKQYSPFGYVRQTEERTDWGTSVTYNVAGVDIMSYDDLFRKHGFINPDNWKLSTIAQLILKTDKLEEGSDFIHDYKHKYQNFIEYNIQDVSLVARLDERKNFFGVMIALAYYTKSNYSDMLGTVTPWKNKLYCLLDADKKQPVLKPISNDDMVLDGGYVQNPMHGRHEWVVSLDLNSLYPHLMQMYNMGIETVVSFDDCPNTLKPYYATNLVETILQNKLPSNVLECLKENNLSLSAYGIPFKKDNYSILNKVTRALYMDRKNVKAEMLRLKDRLEGCSNKDEKANLAKQVILLDTKQHALKIAMNSLYGACGNRYFGEYYDYKIAESITLSGQVALRSVSRDLNNAMNKECGTANHNYVIYGDTDSVAGDSMVSTTEGKLRIESLFDNLCGVVEILGKDNYVKHIQSAIFAKSLNLATGEVEDKKIKYVMKHKVKKRMFRISHGDDSVIVTEDHSIIVNRDGKFLSIKPCELQHSDKIIKL